MIHYLNIPYQLSDPYAMPISRFLSIWKVEVNESYKEYKPAGLGDPGIFITYEGNGVLYEIGGQTREYRLEPNTFFFIQGDVPCRYHCPEDGYWKFFFLHCSDLQMVEYLNLPISTVCHSNTIDFAIHQCERLIQMLIQNKTGAMYTVNQLFQEIIVTLARERTENGKGKNAEISRILYWMHNNIDTSLNVEELVAMSNMSRTLFFKEFKNTTGMTPTAYFLKLKLESAQLALQTTNRTIKQIAESLQFYDEFYFSKLFKREYGVSPSHYREMRK